MYKFKSSKLIVLILTLAFITTTFTGCKSNKADTEKKDKNTVTKAAATPTQTSAATPTPVDYTNATIKDVYANDFKCGVILNGFTINDAKCTQIVKDNFNSVTCENEMKPDFILDRQTSISDKKYDDSPAINFRNADPILRFCMDNGIKMRGHTLVWHAQTPRWLFAENYSDDPNAKLASKEKVLKRMENYIKQVMQYVNTNYPGVIYAWDVVNEAIEVGDKQKDGIRVKNNLWYETCGPEYIEKAFEYARKYAAKDQKLFYNDYSTTDPGKQIHITKLLKRVLKEGNIDGLGMQSHINMTSPTLIEFDESVREYAELGIELQITELDMWLDKNTKADFDKQATRYKKLFLYIKNWKKQGINLSSVTFWGITDKQSWLNTSEKRVYPLLFDDAFNKKPAFYGAIMDTKIPLY